MLVANPLYWRGRPKLDKIIYKIIPDRNALLSQLEAHDVDMWYQFSGAYLARIQALPAYTVFRQPSYAYNHYDFNLTHPAVSDPLVRQALRLALNRQELVEKVEHGIGVIQDSATPGERSLLHRLGNHAVRSRQGERAARRSRLEARRRRHPRKERGQA